MLHRLDLFCSEGFCKNAIKFGWELLDAKFANPTVEDAWFLVVTDSEVNLESMGLSNRVQTIHDFVQVEYKVPIAVTSGLAGIVCFSIKEALTGSSTRRIPLELSLLL
jgi:hypothetical protein